MGSVSMGSVSMGSVSVFPICYFFSNTLLGGLNLLVAAQINPCIFSPTAGINPCCLSHSTNALGVSATHGVCVREVTRSLGLKSV